MNARAEGRHFYYLSPRSVGADEKEAQNQQSIVSSDSATQGLAKTPEQIAGQLEFLIRNIAAELASDEVKDFTNSEWRLVCALQHLTLASLTDLAIHTGTTVGEASRTLRKLSLRQLVHWRKVPTDRRKYEIALTEKGSKAHEICLLQSKLGMRRAIECMSPTDARSAVELLTKCLSVRYAQSVLE